MTWVRNGYLVDSAAAAGSATVSSAAAANAVAPSVGAGAAPVVNAAPAPSTFAFTATGGARLTLAEIEGIATLWGGPTQLVYVGLLAGTPFPDSVCNPVGRYGNASSADSIRNRGGEYGSLQADTSAYNPGATAPPVIKYRNATVALLTRAPGGRGVVDPDVLLNALCR